jgi:predicted flap endonuclease-1-like 5' DNA nuclease
MPEITVTYIAITAGAVALGALIGWIFRGNRCAQEKVTVNEGWQQQLEAQRVEHERLLDQNKTLMEQISQFQASGKDASNRARELSGALKEAFARRDELQRELKEIRSNLEVAVRQRDKLYSDMQSTEARDDSAQAGIKERDEKIFRLSRELENWQERLPPLLERYRERDEEALQLEDDLVSARERIAELENLLNSDETRIEPVDPEALGDELDASNDPNNITQTGLENEFAEEVAEEGAAEPEESTALDEVDEPLDDEVADEEIVAEYDDAEAPVVEAAVGGENVETDEAFETKDSAELGDADVGEPATDDEVDVEVANLDEDDDDEDDSEPVSAQISHLHDHDALEPGGLRDNLKLIKGVGPAIEKTLNELGIFRFHQIAEMTEYDIDRVAQRLKGFRTRIYREDWIGQARDLQLQKSGT